MFIILFLIVLVFFLNIKTLNIGSLGTLHFIGTWGYNPTFIEQELYVIIIVILIILGVLAIRDVLRLFNNYKQNNDIYQKTYLYNDRKLSLEKLIELHDKNLITDEEFLEMKKKI